VAFLGSTIGNLTQTERHRFFVDLDASIDYDDSLLLGTDLVKEPERLLAAYDDEAGTTAAFNRNVLAVLNRELGGHFDLETFVHVARWNADEQWIEMWLQSQVDQQVAIDDLGLTVAFAAGEEMMTEISAKFTAAQVAEELWAGGFVVDASWTDPKGDFLLTLAHPYC
jgi:L-histidine N-alpha-methyltransferase